MYTRPLLESFRYGVSMSFCRRLHQDTLHYLQRECIVRFVVIGPKGLLNLLEK
jgi:hypothetical protein